MIDSYGRRARLSPLLVVATPAIALMTGGAFSFTVGARVVAFAVGGGALLLCAFVRDAGHRTQASLWASWGGSPTTRRLRLRGQQDASATERLHALLASVLRTRLPTRHEEEIDPASADERYDEAVAELRERTRDSDRFAVLASENAEYGFRRNLYGLRDVGKWVGILCACCAGGLLVFESGALADRCVRWGPAAIAGIALPVVLRVWVTSEWVKKAGERYADRLFEATHSLEPSARD